MKTQTSGISTYRGILYQVSDRVMVYFMSLNNTYTQYNT